MHYMIAAAGGSTVRCVPYAIRHGRTFPSGAQGFGGPVGVPAGQPRFDRLAGQPAKGALAGKRNGNARQTIFVEPSGGKTGGSLG